LAGALFDATQSYTYSFIVAACSCLVASLVLWLEIPASRYMRRKEELESRNTVDNGTNGQAFDMLMELHDMS